MIPRPILLRAALQISLVVVSLVYGRQLSAQTGQSLKLRVLVVVYTQSFASTASPEDVAHALAQVERGAEHFQRISRSRLHLAVDHIEIDELLSQERFWEVTPEHFWLPPWSVDGVHSVDGDLLARGVEPDTYDSVAVYYAFEAGPGHYNQYAGASLDVNSVLGKAAYLAISMDYPDVFEHECMHNVAAVLRANGNEDFPNTHEPESYSGVYDNQRTWREWMLAQVPDAGYFEPTGVWGSVIIFADADGDRLPDASPPGEALRITEASFGSSPDLVDSDGDGCTDLEESAAGLSRGTNPLDTDTDGDGLTDCVDPAPFVAGENEARFGSPLLDGNLEGEPYTFVGAVESSDPLDASARFYIAWDNEFLYIAADVTDDVVAVPYAYENPQYNDNVKVELDAAVDGFLHQGDGNYEIRVAPKGATDASRKCTLWKDDGTLDEEAVSPDDFAAAYSITATGWTMELAVPANEALGLRLEPFETVRLQLTLVDYDGVREEGWPNYALFERFTTTELGTAGFEIVVDNGDPGTSWNGHWRVSGALHPYGIDSLYAGKINAGDWYAFEARVPEPGVYAIDAWWTQLTSREPEVPIDITSAHGTRSVTVDQRDNGGQWNRIGVWAFDDLATITIHSLGRGYSTCADAVRLVSIASGYLPPVATIESVTPDVVSSGGSVTFRGHGTDAAGYDIMDYLWISSIDGELSREAEFSTSALSVGEHFVSFTVRNEIGIWSSPAEATVEVTPVAGSGHEVILDNGEPGTSWSGNWKVSSGIEPYGVDSLYAGKLEGGATYTYRLPAYGKYHVYLWWTTMSNRATAVPVDIERAGGVTTVTVDQTRGRGQWNLVATEEFDGTAVVTIRAPGGATTCADAVRILRASDAGPFSVAILDNGVAGTSSTGLWKVSGACCHYGPESLYAGKTTVGATYTYQLAVPPGDYLVSLWWTRLSSRETEVPVEIVYAGGIANVTVDQTRDGGQWNAVGTWSFDDTMTVTIRSLGRGMSTCADAVRVDRIEEE